MENKYPKISFVSPVFKADKILPKLIFEIEKVMLKIGEDYEIILIDDRCPDNSWEVMRELSSNHKKIKSIRLSKNFGQHPAIIAGLSQAHGEWIVVLDCDLQDQPKEVEKLFNKANEGFDIVLAQRKKRKDSYYKKMTSLLFSKMFGFFTDTEYDSSIANFGIYHKK